MVSDFLHNESVYLRALEPLDIDFLYGIENNVALWPLSDTQIPFSRDVLIRYIENAQQDLYTAKQLRLVICTQALQKPIGFIDLFDFEPMHLRAGVGIVILKSERGKGYGKKAVQLLCNYAKEAFFMHQLYANVAADNAASIQLFTSLDFKQIGIKKEWQKTSAGYKDEILFQCILKKL